MHKHVNGRFAPTSATNPSYQHHRLLVEFQQAIATRDTSVLEAAQPEFGQPAERPRTDEDTPRITEEQYAELPAALRETLERPRERAAARSSAVTRTTWIARRLAVTVAADGRFGFSIPEAEQIRGSIRLRFESPTGAVLWSDRYSYAALHPSSADADRDKSAELRIEADPFQPLKLQRADDPTPYRVRGRAFRFEDGTPLRSRQLFIHAGFVTETESLEPRVVATTATDATGYFSFEMPAGRLGIAFAKLGGAQGPTTQLTIDRKQQSADAHQVLVFEGVEDDEDQSDCSCNAPTPSGPDATDLANSTVYSNDLGGQCVSFTSPDRSLEEFDYYMVVRTTEPEIRKIPWQKPPTLNPVVPVTSAPGNAAQVDVSEAFRALVAKHQEVSYGELDNSVALFGHMPGYGSLGPELQAGAHQWWIFETKMLVFLGDEAEERYGPYVGSALAQGFARINGIEQLIVELQPKSVFEYYCKDPARDTFIEFYGRTPLDDNELYTFWLYAGQEFHGRVARLPNDPQELEDFIRQTLLLTANDGPGEFWLFSIDYASYTAPGGVVPLQHLQSQLGALFATVYGTPHQLDLELLEFLRLAVSQFKDDYGRIPRTPEELFGYIRLAFESGAGGRMELDGTHPIDWDETPTLYHNTTIAHGHILHFKQVWRADGYSMGDLLYSLPLAPCQKKQIVIHDWDRRDMASRDEFLSADERMSAYLDRDRDVTDIMNTSFSETIKGGSQAQTKGFSLGLGHSGGGGGAAQVPVQGMQFGGVVGTSSGFGMQYSSGSGSSSAWQDSARQLSAKGLNQLRENVMQGASSVRNQRATVVQVVNQGERTSVQTEVIANHNHCHSITMEYFEVLRHFAVEQRLADVQECLFIPMEMKPFDIHKTLRWSNELASSIYDPELREGFAALETIEAHYLNTGVRTGMLAEEQIQAIHGEIELSMVIARPEDDLDNDGGYTVSLTRWAAIAPILGPWTPVGVRSHFLALAQAERERMFREEMLPDILASFIDALEFGYVDMEGTEHVLKLDVVADSFAYNARSRGTRLRDFLQSYDPGSPLRLKLRMLPGQGRIARSEVAWFYIKNAHLLPEGSRVSFRGGHLRYITASLDEALFNVWNQNDDIGDNDPATIRTPLNSREQFNPIQDLYDKGNRLISHLNDHLEFYHKVIWYQLDPDKRFMMLDGFIAPNSGSRSVASVVENRVIGVVGNNLVMPVVRGAHLDPSFAQDVDAPVDLLAHYAPTTPLEPFRISVPTRGVYAEAVMGACNSCEKIDESRHWRFTEVPCGSEPTAIAPVSTGSRYQAPGDLQAKDLPTNIINLQNIPQAPDPASLSSAISVLGTPGIFENLTGLDQNQLNALESLLANQKGAIEAMRMNTEAATKYAEMAKELAMHSSMVKNADKVIGRTEQQVDKGNLSPDEGKEIIKKALETMGGGSTPAGEGATEGAGGQGGRRVNVSPTQELLPDNPAMFTSYEASSGSGDSVSYTTSGSGAGVSQDSAPDQNPPQLSLRSSFFKYGIDISAYWRFETCLNVVVGTQWHVSFIGSADLGEHVSVLQRALNILDPNLNLTVDGVFGAATEQAVRAFQTTFTTGGFITMVDGVVGPETMRILDEVMYHIEQEGIDSITPAQVQAIRDKVQRQVQRENAVGFPVSMDIGQSDTRTVWEALMHVLRIKRTTNRLSDAGKYDVFRPYGEIDGADSGVATQENQQVGPYRFDLTTHVPLTSSMNANNVLSGSVEFLGDQWMSGVRDIRMADNDGKTIVLIRVWASGPFEQDGLTFYAAMRDYIIGRTDFEDLLQELGIN